MASVDGLAGVWAGWAALGLGAYLAAGFVAAVAAQRRTALAHGADRLLALYPRAARVVLRSLAAAAVGLAVSPATSAVAAGQTGGGAPRPPVVAPARPGAEPLDWPVSAPARHHRVPTPQHRRTGTPPPAAAAAAHPIRTDRTTRDTARTVTVEDGDCLWSLAARAIGPDASVAEVAAAWPRWWTANREVIGADPDLLRPGVVLHAPTTIERSAS